MEAYVDIIEALLGMQVEGFSEDQLLRIWMTGKKQG